MRLLSYNIQYGFGRDGRHDLSRAIAVMRGADLIALQEVERNWPRSGMQDQPALIMDALPQHYAVYGPAFDMDASRVEGGRVVNRRRQFGAMILSRWPIRWSRLHLLPMRRMIDPLNTQNPALETLIETPFGPIRVWSIHLAHVGVQERLEQIAYLKSWHERVALTGPPWSGRDDEPDRDWAAGEAEPPCPASAIWMGDFNCEPSGAEHAAITGQAPYHPGALYHAGLTDAVAHLGVGLHTHAKTIAGRPRLRQLDHCFVTADLVGRLAGAWADPETVASDHAPLWIDLA